MSNYDESYGSLCRDILESISDGFISLDHDMVITYFNRSAEKLLGRNAEDVTGERLFEAFPEAKGSLFELKYKEALVENKFLSFETYFSEKPYENWYEVKVYPQNQGITVYFQVVTDRKAAEEELKRHRDHLAELVQEKTREIQYRLKNNLAVIQSILKLQAGQIEDDAAKLLFDESRNRVMAMSMIHDRLYQSVDHKSLSLSEYIRSLAVKLFRSSGLHASRVKLSFAIPDAEVDIDTLIPAGLILTEALTNALKYAFPDNREGEIKIMLSRDGEREYTLTVKDNGTGLPEGLDIHDTRTLGFQIVTSLIKQIGGRLEIKRDEGTEFRLNFRDKASILSSGTPPPNP